MDAESLKKLKTVISDANLNYVQAVALSAGVPVAKERFKNILFGRIEEIMEALEYAATASEENEALKVSLEEADDEYVKLKKQLKDAQRKSKAIVEKPAETGGEAASEA